MTRSVPERTSEARGINNVSESDIRRVMNDMMRLGPPTIRVLRHAGVLYAIEGTTRLIAAQRLNVRPNIVVLADDDTDESLGIIDVYSPGETRTVRQLRETHIPEGNIRPTFEIDM